MPSDGVSIIVATLNRRAYLREAVASALVQTFSNFELLVCDDSASTETETLCTSFCDSRIVYRANSKILGIAMNTLGGLQAARNDLVALLNDDDRWTPDFLAKTVSIAHADPAICLVFSDHWLINSSGARLPRETDANAVRYGRHVLPSGRVENTKLLIVHNSIPLAMAALFRKSAIDWSVFSPNAGGAYDLFLSYHLVRTGRDVYYIPERLTEYRVHATAASATHVAANALDRFWVSKAILEDPLFTAYSHIWRSWCVEQCKQVRNAFLRQKQVILAFKYHMQALRYRFSL